MAHKIRKMFNDSGEVGMALLMSVVGGVVVSFIIGGVLTWGYTQTVKVEIEAIQKTLTRIEACATTDRALLASTVIDVEKLKYAGLTNGTPLNIDVIKSIMNQVRDDMRREFERQAKVKKWQDIPNGR